MFLRTKRWNNTDRFTFRFKPAWEQSLNAFRLKMEIPHIPILGIWGIMEIYHKLSIPDISYYHLLLHKMHN